MSAGASVEALRELAVDFPEAADREIRLETLACLREIRDLLKPRHARRGPSPYDLGARRR